MNVDLVKHVHFVGIGGIGMSGIAEVLLELNFEVSGSDIADSSTLTRLRKSGARVSNGHRPENVDGAKVVVVSSAIADDNIEILAARKAKIPVVARAEMLGELMRFRKGIAVAGTHGKTTTTSLVSSVLVNAGFDPTFVVGGIVNSEHANARLGQGEYIVVEADESDSSFLHLQPDIAIMTNIDTDHLSAYDGNFDRLKEACLAFLHNLPFYGLAILCFESPAVRSIAPALSKPIVSYGFSEDVDFRACNLRQTAQASFFTVEHEGRTIGEYQLPLPGKHNVLNALAAITIANRLKIESHVVADALAKFEGISRRFEVLGEIKLPNSKGVIELIDDYAHHPTELHVTIEAAHTYRGERRLVVIFQPHRYTRTYELFDDFVQVLSGVDNLIITPVYPAGESPMIGSDGISLCRALRKRGADPIYIEMPALLETLPSILQDGDVLLTMGAGDIAGFVHSLMETGLSPPGKAE